MTSHRSRTTALIAAAALLGAACTGEGEDLDAGLRAELAVSQAAQQDLEDRVAALEETLSAEGEDDAPDPLRAIGERLDALDEALSGLDGSLDAEVEARAGGDDGLAAELAVLSGRIDELQNTVVQLRTNVQELTDEVSSLEAQFKAHRNDDQRHN